MCHAFYSYPFSGSFFLCIRLSVAYACMCEREHALSSWWTFSIVFAKMYMVVRMRRWFRLFSCEKNISSNRQHMIFHGIKYSECIFTQRSPWHDSMITVIDHIVSTMARHRSHITFGRFSNCMIRSSAIEQIFFHHQKRRRYIYFHFFVFAHIILI